MDKKIDFLIIGAQKAGTSALDQYLRQHPAIGMARQKELHFFDNESIFSKKEVDYGLLESQFDRKDSAQCYGEATPIYIYWEPAMKRIWEYNRDMKLVAILRNPVDRAFSHWNMEVARGLEKEDFFYCVKNEAERSLEASPFQHRTYTYVDRGRYPGQIRRVYRYFPKDQVLFIKYEDYLQKQGATVGAVLEFLGVETSSTPAVAEKIFAGNYARVLRPEERDFLTAALSNDIDEVEQLLGWDCADWKK